jgi:hypothetical protein
MQDNSLAKKAAAIAAVPLAVILGAGQAEALTSQDVKSLTYLQVKQSSSDLLSAMLRMNVPMSWIASIAPAIVAFPWTLHRQNSVEL